MRILLARRDVTQVLGDPSVNPKEKSLIRLAREAKRYGEEQIGLRRTHNFDTYVRLDRKVVCWVVSAAGKTRLEAYRWWFPVVGTVPYKGYFERPRAEEGPAALQRGVRHDGGRRGRLQHARLVRRSDLLDVSAVSGGGDPQAEFFTSSPTRRSSSRERSTSTRGFATFLGNTAGLAFLARRFGPDDRRVREARARIADDVAFGAFIEKVSRRLEALYARKLPERETLARREEIFREEKRAFEETKKGFSTPIYDDFTRQEWNNAVILANRRYYGDLAAFERLYQAKGRDLRRVLEFFLDAQKRGEDPRSALRRATGTAGTASQAEAG